MLEFEARLQHWLEISYTIVSEFYKSWTEEQTPKQASKQLLQHVRNMPISNGSKDVTWISWTS